VAWKVPFARSGRIRSFSREAAEADDLQQQVSDTGATPILDCCRGQVVTACGVLRSVTVRPVAGSPALEADLYDGSGHLRLVWLGRRHISGIEAGRSVTITGRLADARNQATVFNPRYQLQPVGPT